MLFCCNTCNFTIKAVSARVYLCSVASSHWAPPLLLFASQSMHSWAGRRGNIPIIEQDISSKLLVFPLCSSAFWYHKPAKPQIFQFLSRSFSCWPSILQSNLEIPNDFSGLQFCMVELSDLIVSSFNLTTIIMFSRTVTVVSTDSAALGQKQFCSASKGHVFLFLFSIGQF